MIMDMQIATATGLAEGLGVQFHGFFAIADEDLTSGDLHSSASVFVCARGILSGLVAVAMNIPLRGLVHRRLVWVGYNAL